MMLKIIKSKTKNIFDKMERLEVSGRNIEHILLAEFDIDKGSTLKHQIPGPIPNYADEYAAASTLLKRLLKRFTY